MVAKITIPKSIEAALNYNEKKVQKGTAQCVFAGNYLNDANKMNFYQKLDGFETNNRLNKMATTKTLHVSLNFDPTENLSESKLVEIAGVYMEKIGFGEQPFLVYKHEDAGHPHIHIVSTTIQNDGSRINTHNIGRNQSEKARKEIEQAYGLVRAERQQQIMKPGIKPVDAEKAIYGISETKRSISNVVSAVFSQFKFSSLPEFNAALKQFNVVADRGKEDGRIYKNRGLVYRILDAEGNKVGVPIKASTIGCKPMLDNLEKQFLINDSAKESLKQRTKSAIDDCLQTSPASMNNLVAALRQKQIYTVLRRNAEGRLYGITFVDNQNKVVFNGSDLGKGYSAAALQSRLSQGGKDVIKKVENKSSSTSNSNSSKMEQKQFHKSNELPVKNESLLETLMSAKEQFENVPNNLLQKKRKKKKKNHNL
ncbi:relaxase/mobilization nuclease domain-containing protein [Ferruginibacter paludis]|uniref:relaxase/mobilization nuclease domain-containing protein n=1 Tax=Ferruginibacter paludis TaxID=1310417 RepID=UPI0025B2E33A|nr:relaxase/mobilization nuclease domain-containing protein [Ferruginibacter paludis]MDN3657844.1 relaxase/mobilization nuclease domain-containing protein [Ferruginibacter paludis]